MTVTHVRLLGAAQVNSGSDWIELPPGKTSALLYYLAYKNDWVSRDELVFLLWPDSSEGAARKNLRQLLSTIRRSPYAKGVETEENRLRWLVDTDVKKFRAALAEGNMATATQLYPGALLQGFAVDLPEFEQWLDAERQELQASWQETALAFVSELEHSNRYLQAADLLARLRRDEPLDEELLQRHLSNLARAGQNHKALTTYDAFHKALAQDYDAEPEEETLRLVERLRRGEAPEEEAPLVPRTHGDSVAPRRHNLPLDPTPFIGREATKARAVELLQEPSRRLLTLVGPGGIGKTRLAIEVARAHVDRYEDGVFFVNLAPVTSPDLLITGIADAVGFAFYGATHPKEQLFAFLHDKHLLLVLDNFEQLLPAAPLVAELLGFTPKLRVLATSRAALHLSGEQVYEVPPLGLPTPGETPSLESMSQYEAVALFIERALAVKPDFQVTNENAPAVAEICHRLDGLALAIELAAARTKLFPPQALLSRLRSRLQTLTGGAQDLPSRQQTLRNTIDWGYDLLPVAEQKLFARLSVFLGGCSLEAIEAVCDPNNDLAIDLLEGVDSLVSKSLLRHSEHKGEPRFTMLETIHEYAQEKLGQGEDAAAVQQAHAGFFLRLAEEADPHIVGPEQAAWLERLEVDQDNLRAVLRWSEETGETEVALRLSGVLFKYWRSRSYLSEGRAWLAKVLSRSESMRTAARGKALLGAGLLADLQGDYLSASKHYEESLEIRRELGDNQGIAQALNNLGSIAMEQGDYALARSLMEETLALDREFGSDELAAPIGNLGSIAYREGDYVLARTLYEEGLAILRESGDEYNIAIALNDLGLVALAQGDDPMARSFLKESLSLRQNLRDLHGIVDSLTAHAALQAVGGTPERAARLYGAAEALREATGISLAPVERPSYEREVEAVRAQLDESSFRKAWAQGRGMSLDEALDYVARED